MNHPRHANPAAPPPPPPQHRNPSTTLIAAGLVPIFMSAAAAITSIWCQDHLVARTAWIAVAVVGTATMISAALCIRPLTRRCHPSHGPQNDNNPPGETP